MRLPRLPDRLGGELVPHARPRHAKHGAPHRGPVPGGRRLRPAGPPRLERRAQGRLRLWRHARLPRRRRPAGRRDVLRPPEQRVVRGLRQAAPSDGPRQPRLHPRRRVRRREWPAPPHVQLSHVPRRVVVGHRLGAEPRRVGREAAGCQQLVRLRLRRQRGGCRPRGAARLCGHGHRGRRQVPPRLWRHHAHGRHPQEQAALHRTRL
mmetsp:Transcript_17914/g.52228  ORF Transcript_17914/g.52228 Transcript_17914/m.52228 type:complete len:207 (+) Transcript_17914:508-1128(+)